jgi:chromosome segregation ATPase
MAVARKKATKKRPSSGKTAAGPFVTVSRFKAAQEHTDEQFRYLGAVLEDVRSQNRATIEAVLGQRQETKRLIEDLESRITPRLDVLESVVREHSGMLQAHGHALDGLNQKVDRLEQKVDKLDERLGVVEQKVDKLDERLGVVEQKVDKLDERLGVVEQKVDKLDERLGVVEQKVDKLDERLGVVEQKVDKLDERLANVEQKVDGIDRKLDTKADASLEPRVATLERAAG